MTHLYSQEELLNKFELELVNKNMCQVNFDILNELNRTYIQKELVCEKKRSEMARKLRQMLDESNIKNEQYNEDRLKDILLWSQTKITTLKDLVSDEFNYIWRAPENLTLKDNFLDRKQVAEILELISISEEPLKGEKVIKQLRKLCKKQQWPFSQTMKSIRFVLSGKVEGPPIGELLQVLGKTDVIQRLGNVNK